MCLSLCIITFLLNVDQSKSTSGELIVEQEGGEIFHYKILSSYHSSKDAMLVHSHFPHALTHATWVVRQRDTFLECPARQFVAILSYKKVPLDYLYTYINNRNHSSSVSSHSAESADYDYNVYYYDDHDDQVAAELVNETHNAPIVNEQNNVLVGEGTLGYGWGRSVSFILNHPLPGRWYVAMAVLGEEDAETQPFNLKLSSTQEKRCVYSLQSMLKWKQYKHIVDVSIQPQVTTTREDRLQPGMRSLYYRFSELSGITSLFIGIVVLHHVADNEIGTVFSKAALPNSSKMMMCHSNVCTREVMITSWDDVYYLQVTTNSSLLQYTISIHAKGCNDSDIRCIKAHGIYRESQPVLGARYLHHYHQYQYLFSLEKSGYEALAFDREVNVLSTGEEYTAYRFTVDAAQDAGAALTLTLTTLQQQHKHSLEVTSVCVEQELALLRRGNFQCTNALSANLTHSSEQRLSYHVLMHYPADGTWFIVTRRLCYGDNHTRSVCRSGGLLLELAVQPCPYNCSVRGQCVIDQSAGLIYAYCSCNIGWKGLDCGLTEHLLHELPMLAVMLLTTSNAAFLPPICLALHRNMLTEALLYSFTMLISAAYHFCDVLRPYHSSACVLPFHILAISDFFASILSFGATLLSVSAVSEKWRGLGYIGLTLFLLVAVQMDRTALWVFLVPLLSSIITCITSWLYRTYKYGSKPSSMKRVVLLCTGVLCALTAMLIFAFASTTKNYLYIHSLWHFLIATSIIFLLPYKRPSARPHLTSSKSFQNSISCSDSTVSSDVI